MAHARAPLFNTHSHRLLVGALLPTSVAAFGDNLQDQLARLFTAVFGTHDLDSFVLSLVARDLDLSAGLLAEIVDGATAGADHKSTYC